MSKPHIRLRVNGPFRVDERLLSQLWVGASMVMDDGRLLVQGAFYDEDIVMNPRHLSMLQGKIVGILMERGSP